MLGDIQKIIGSASRRTEMKMKIDHAPVLFLAFSIASVINLGGASPAHGAVIKSTKEWAGQLEDGKLKKEKPVDRLFTADGFITNKEDFAKVWKAWMGKEKLPEIDFDKELVVVASSSKGRIFEILLIEEKGDVKTIAGSRAAEVKGFTFMIAVFKREGIKTIDGQPIKK
jgi:hypothetical protein